MSSRMDDRPLRKWVRAKKLKKCPKMFQGGTSDGPMTPQEAPSPKKAPSWRPGCRPRCRMAPRGVQDGPIDAPRGSKRSLPVMAQKTWEPVSRQFFLFYGSPYPFLLFKNYSFYCCSLCVLPRATTTQNRVGHPADALIQERQRL